MKEGLINLAQLEKAVAVQRQEGGHLGEILVRLGMVKDEQMVAILAKQLNIPYFSLGTGMLKPAVDQGLDKLIPQDFARKNCVLPLSRTLRSLTV
ncbi:MAG: type II secretion system protein GspE, partial [Candidatus Omnitrophota bacterium]